MAGVKVEGADELAALLAKLENPDLTVPLSLAAERLRDVTIPDVPFLTGQLRDSSRIESGPEEARLEWGDQPYAGIQEERTRFLETHAEEDGPGIVREELTEFLNEQIGDE